MRGILPFETAGFGIIFAIISLFVVAYLQRRSGKWGGY